jgi:hypothetical protein
MKQEAATPQDGNIYVRVTPSLTWSVERWHPDASRYEAHYADTREAGERLARDWAALASAKVFVLDRGGITALSA